NATALVVESNATGQFAFMLKGSGYDQEKVASLLKYDGTLFTVKEIVDGARAVLAGEARYLVTGGGQGVRPTDDPTIALTAKEAKAKWQWPWRISGRPRRPGGARAAATSASWRPCRGPWWTCRSSRKRWRWSRASAAPARSATISTRTT